MREWNIVKVYYSRDSYTCEHCGRIIKNIALLHNNVTGEEMQVGLTCLDKIMKLNENFAKALQKEIKNYYKEVEYYNRVMTDKDSETNDKWFATAQMVRATETLNKFSKNNLIVIKDLEGLKSKLNKLEIELNKEQETKKETKKETQQETPEEYIGSPGTKVELKKVELIEVSEYDNCYGTSYYYEFKFENYKIIWQTTKDIGKVVGDIINLKGTIKDNRECEEGNYTFLTRCKILE